MKVDLTGALRRRWYVVLIGLLLTPTLCFAALQVVGPKYEAKAMLVLLPPGASVPKVANPYLNLGSMQPVVGVLADSMVSQQTALRVRALSRTAEYTVAPDPSTSGAVLIIDVEDNTSAGAAKVLKNLTTMIPVELNQLQKTAGTSASSRITTDLVAQDTKPEANHKTQERMALLAAAFGVAATVLAASFIDGFASNPRTLIPRVRRSRSAEDAAESSSPTDVNAPDADVSDVEVPDPGVADADPPKAADDSRPIAVDDLDTGRPDEPAFSGASGMHRDSCL